MVLPVTRWTIGLAKCSKWIWWAWVGGAFSFVGVNAGAGVVWTMFVNILRAFRATSWCCAIGMADRVCCAMGGIGASSCLIPDAHIRLMRDRAPGVLFRVTHWCRNDATFNNRFAVGLRNCMIGSVLDMRWTVMMGVSSITL